MSDDFDKDDLDWLRGDDDDNDNTDSGTDDDLDLDWLKDDDDTAGTPSRDEGRLGVTGELDWLRTQQGFDDNPAQESGRSGVTDELDWMAEDDSGTDSGGGDDDDFLPDWMAGADADEVDEPEDDFGFDDSPSPFADPDTPDEDALPDWMNAPAAESELPVFPDDSAMDADDADLDADLPPWMQGMGIDDDLETVGDDVPLYADDAPAFDDDAPAWLTGTGSLSAPDDEADAPDENIPDWMHDTGMFETDDDDDAVDDSAPAAREDIPDWLGGSDVFDDDEVVPQSASAGDVPDWLSDTGALADHLDEIAEEDSADVPDWLSGTGALASDDDEPLYADEPEPAPTQGDVPDWLSGTGALVDDSADDEPLYADEPEPVPTQGDLPDWLSGTGALADDDDEPLFEDQPVEEAESDAVPDWMSGADDFGDDDLFAEETPQPVAESDSFDDLFGDDDLFDERDDEMFAEPQAEAELDFDNLFDDDDFAEPEEEFDLVSEADSSNVDDLLAESDEDDFDLLGELSASGGMGLTGLLGDQATDENAQDDAFADLFDDDDDDVAQPVAESDGFDDLFGDDEDVAQPVAESDSFDDLFGDDEDIAQPVAESNGFDDLFGDDEDVAQPVAESDGFDDLFGDDESDDDYADLFGDDDDVAQPAASAEADDDESFDWFAEEEVDAELATPDWLSEVKVDDEYDLDPLDDDVFVDFDEPETEAPAQRQFENVDDFLSSLGDDKALALPQTGDLSELQRDVDFEDLFETGIQDFELSEEEALTPDAPSFDTSPDRPDWLDDVGVNIGGISAASLVRGQKDVPIEDLPDRLQALHQRGREMRGSQAVASPELDELLPGVTNALPAVDFGKVSPALSEERVSLSAAQQQNAELLRAIVGGELLDLPEEDAQPAPRARRLSFKGVDRVLIVVVLLLAVVSPFVFDFLRVGDLPPAEFEAGSRQMAFFGEVQSLGAGDVVLVAAEYGATGAAELDPPTQAVLRHILQQGARPFVVSGNAVGLLHAGNILTDLAADLTENEDYYVGRYLVAEAVGLRAFGEDIATLTDTDSQGRETNLEIESLNDFALIVVVAERSDVLRLWAEQIAPETQTPFIGVTGAAAAPLAQPYIEAQGDVAGLLVGYADAYTYFNMLGLGAPPELPDVDSMVDAEETPEIMVTEITETPTSTEPPTATPQETEEVTEATEEPDAVIPPDTDDTTPTEPTPQETDEVEATATTPPTATPDATDTPAPTETPAESPTPTVEPTAEAELVRFGVVNASGNINVRGGPSTGAAVVNLLRPGDRVLIIGQNEDESWYEILLDDGSPGWVAAFLLDVEVELVPASEITPTPTESDDEGNGKAIPRRHQDDDAEATPEATPEVTADASVDVADVIEGDVLSEVTTIVPLEYRDERWYATTLGLVASIVVIFGGTIINVLRALARRRRGE